MDGIDAMFGDLGFSISDLGQDLKYYAPVGAAALGGVLAWKMIDKNVIAKLPGYDKLSGPVITVLESGLEIVVGIMAGNYVRRWHAGAGLGLTIGLVSDGILELLREFLPDSMKTTIGLSGDELILSGLGVPYSHQFGPYSPRHFGASPNDPYGLLSAAPVSVEEAMNAAPVSIEENIGAAPMSVEEMNGFGGFAGVLS